MEHDDVREMVECERDEAKEEGIQIGIGLGIEQGIVRGRRELVQRMLENGLAPEQVANLTGVGLNEIQEMAG